LTIVVPPREPLRGACGRRCGALWTRRRPWCPTAGWR